MKEVLFLVHRIPYPPNKGDKIRAFHVLKWLSALYRVHLCAFVDDIQDWRYATEIDGLCAETCLRPLSPSLARLRSLQGFATGEPLTLPYYRDPVMHSWVNDLLTTRTIHAVVAYSSCMAQYAAGAIHARRIVDFVDLDSDKWRQFAETQAWPWSWVYRREARRLAFIEARVASDFDASIFVSHAELDLFRQQNPRVAARSSVINNGVDTEYFSPKWRGIDPYAGNRHVIAFTGAMDYWPNVDAVTWFAQDVFPRIRTRVADARFYIVGAKPTRKVLALSKQPGVYVTGSVPDVRPYVGHAAVVVAPLRIARGVQNKVLEAMAMERPVLMTQDARKGLEASPICDSLVAGDPQELANKAIIYLCGLAPSKIGEQSRHFVEQHYNWSRNLGMLSALLENDFEQRRPMAEAI